MDNLLKEYGNKKLAVLSGERRFLILKELIKSPDYTISLARKLKVESSIITHSLKRLEKEGFIESYRIKNCKNKFYRLKDKKNIISLFRILKKLNENDKK